MLAVNPLFLLAVVSVDDDYEGMYGMTCGVHNAIESNNRFYYGLELSVLIQKCCVGIRLFI